MGWTTTTMLAQALFCMHGHGSGPRCTGRDTRDTPPPRSDDGKILAGVPARAARRDRESTLRRGSPRACGQPVRRTSRTAQGCDTAPARARPDVIVVDASVLANALADDTADGDRARER